MSTVPPSIGQRLQTISRWEKDSLSKDHPLAKDHPLSKDYPLSKEGGIHYFERGLFNFKFNFVSIALPCPAIGLAIAAWR